jgi:hypothetical protein
MGRRENRSDSVTYENVIPNLLHNEPITYVELDFNVQKNSNPENAAAEINSTTLNQKRDIKGYVDSVIYAELRKWWKCWKCCSIILMLFNPITFPDSFSGETLHQKSKDQYIQLI